MGLTQWIEFDCQKSGNHARANQWRNSGDFIEQTHMACRECGGRHLYYKAGQHGGHIQQHYIGCSLKNEGVCFELPDLRKFYPSDLLRQLERELPHSNGMVVEAWDTGDGLIRLT